MILVIVALLVIVVILISLLGQANKRADEAETKALKRAAETLKRTEKEIRSDAIVRSKVVVTGKVAEQFVPFTSEFNYNPRDARFLGSPVDFVVFEGLTEGSLNRIIFVEVKTGKYGRLSKRERQVQLIVKDGEVDYEVLHLRPSRTPMSTRNEAVQGTE